MGLWARIQAGWQRADARLDAWIGDLWSEDVPPDPAGEDSKSVRHILVNLVWPVVCAAIFLAFYFLRR